MNKTPIGLKPGEKALTAGKGIDPDALKDRVIELLLRAENNLIQVNDDNEVYVDLQLPAGIKPTDDFPVGVTTGKILQADGRQQSGLILNWKTTSGDYFRLIYANDGKLYYDPGTGVRHEFGGNCNCHNVVTVDFYDNADNNHTIQASPSMTTPSKGTIIVGNGSHDLYDHDQIKYITFDGETTVAVIYPNGTIGSWWMDTQNYDTYGFTGIMTDSGFFVRSLGLIPGA